MLNIAERTSLKTLLTLDGATCALMGLILMPGAGLVSALTDIPAPFLFYAGALLLPVAVFMVLSARARTVPAWAASIAVLGNVLWVLASVLIPLTGAIEPNAPGWVLLLGQAVAVAMFARFEYEAMRKPLVAA